MKAAIGCLIGLVFVVSASAEPLLEGRVRLESGEPVADAQVRLFDMTDLRQGAIARAMTDGRGYFALPLAALGGQALPARFALGPNYPNPFNPSTIIPYQLAASSAVRLEVFNLLGQHIATLVDGERPAGFHTATWHATDAAGRAVGAGVYIYRMMVGVESQTGRMVLLDGQAGVSAGAAASVMPGASGIGGSDGADAQVYGLIVSGSGLVPYVDSSFRVEAGMAPVELVVSAGQPSAGKATDDDCAFCDLFGTFNDQQEEEEDETTEEEEEDETTEEEEEDETTEEEEEETDSTSSEGGPDLIVQSPSVSAVMLTPGQEFTLHVTVHNQGDGQAAATTLHYYRSNNATITSSDTEVGTDEIGVLDASATSAKSIALTAPTSVSAEVGSYYGACVGSVSGESNTDNNCSSAVEITVSGQVATEEEETEEEEAGEATEEEEEDDTPVTIPDANLRSAIEDALGKAKGATVTVAEMKRLIRLHASEAGIGNLTGLEFATNLKDAVLWGNRITNVSPLSGLTNLEELHLAGNNISNLSPLVSLTNLERLSLQSMTTSLSDISALANLTNLEFLNLTNNNITDISALTNLTKLTELYVGQNNIADISALAGLTNLTELSLAGNNIKDISALAGLTSLKGLYLWDNNISDLAPLVANTGLGSEDVVKVTENPLNAASKGTHIPALLARGVRISFDDTELVVFSEPQIYNDNVFVLPVSENLAVGNLPLEDYAARFYEYFSDAFDFLMFFPYVYREQLDLEAFRGAYYSGVKNDVRGIGQSIFFGDGWGSAGRLQGAIYFSEAFYNAGSVYSRLITGPSLHELMHRWANFILPTYNAVHWGFSSADGTLGGFILDTLVDLGGGRYRAASFSYGGYYTNNIFYSPIELYLAGFIPPEEVPDLWVAEDGQPVLNEDGEWDFRSFTASRVKTYTIDDIIAEHGSRVPDHSQAQKDFRAAVILLVSEDYPVTRSQLAFLSADASWFSHAGEVESIYNNFYEATGGRATITMDDLSQFKSRASAKRLVPSSFGTPPPPIVDHWE